MTGSAAGIPIDLPRSDVSLGWTRLRDNEDVRADGFAIEEFNGGSSTFRGDHCHESESAWPLAGVIDCHFDAGDVPEGGEQVREFAFRGGGGKIFEIDFGVLHQLLRMRLFSQVFEWVAYSIEPFRFCICPHSLISQPANSDRDVSRDESHLFH